MLVAFSPQGPEQHEPKREWHFHSKDAARITVDWITHRESYILVIGARTNVYSTPYYLTTSRNGYFSPSVDVSYPIVCRAPLNLTPWPVTIFATRLEIV